jgi:hypothetical protein
MEQKSSLSSYENKNKNLKQEEVGKSNKNGEKENTINLQQNIENKNNITPLGNKYSTVSDREIMTIIKEEKRLPISFSRPIKLSLLIKYYNKYWYNDFTDESDEIESDTDERNKY